MQTHFCHSTLGTKLKVEVSLVLSLNHIPSLEIHDGLSNPQSVGKPKFHNTYWKASENSLNHASSLTRNSKDKANLWVYLCYDTATYGTAGIAWMNSICRSKELSSSMNEKQSSAAGTAQLVAHEIGHNLGMSHDFDPQHGGQNGYCDCKGIMSYCNNAPQRWSSCSRNDFKAHYNMNKGNWCLPSKSSLFIIIKVN